MTYYKKAIYLDNNATTQVSIVAKDAYEIILDSYIANPSSQSKEGARCSEMLEIARLGIKKIINANSCNLYFTSGATEANNIVIKTYLEIALGKKLTVLTTKLEHSSVLNIFKHYENIGLKVVYLNKNQTYQLKDIEELPEIFFASIMTYNNESGIYADVKKFRKLFGDKTIIHSDITQMLGKVHTDIESINADFYTFSGHKFHSTKGIGGIIARKGSNITPLFIGGGQESGIRSGTSNIASAYSMFKALEEATEHLNNMNKVQKLRDEFEELIVKKIEGTKIIGKEFTRLPNTSYLMIPGISSDILVSNLNGLTIGNGSACNTYSHDISHVAKEMTNTHKDASSVIRISMSRFNTKEEILTAVNMIVKEVSYIRSVGL